MSNFVNEITIGILPTLIKILIIMFIYYLIKKWWFNKK